MSADPTQALGLIAGRGALPFELARSARLRGRRVAAIAFHEQTDARLESEVDTVTWLHLGQVRAVLDALRAAGAREAVMVGKVRKADFLAAPTALQPDATALELMEELRDAGDDSILEGVARFLESHGIRLLPQAELVPDLMAGEGPLGRSAASAAIRADVAFGWPIAKAVAGLDVGQTLVVKDRAVLAVEAIEGTDAAIRRAGAICAGATVIKVAKPHQDPRFDVPAIGSETVAALRDAKAGALAFEAGRTLVMNRMDVAAAADALGIAVIGVRDGQIPADGA